MAQKEFTVRFTNAELNHIECLLRNNESEGWYFAPKEQYWNRHLRIALKLECARTGGKKTVQHTTGKG